MICLDNITKAYGDHTVLHNFSLTVNEGEHIAIMGKSGKGKTTLLRIIADLETPDSGSISGFTKEDISYVFQESRLFEHLTVLDNVAVVCDQPLKEARIEAMKYLDAVGLSDSAELFPSEISGGMAQRVAIVRALIRNTPILLMDEPFSALDNTTRNGMLLLLCDLCRDKTLLLVTHDPFDARMIANHIIDLDSISE